MPIPKIIHQAWFGPRPLPAEMRAWQRSVQARHPGWTHHFWHEGNCQDIAWLRHELSSYGSVTNVVRLARLHALGGVWLDTDVECLRPLDELLAVGAFAAFDGGIYDFLCYEGGPSQMVCNAVMGAVPGHPWIARQLAALPDFLALPPPWGPKLATDTLGEDVTLYPTEFFYPFHWQETPADPYPPQTYLVHHWTGSWQTPPEDLPANT